MFFVVTAAFILECSHVEVFTEKMAWGGNTRSYDGFYLYQLKYRHVFMNHPVYYAVLITLEQNLLFPRWLW